MPGANELQELSKHFGLTLAVLLLGCGGLVAAVRSLYAQNQQLHERLERLLEERGKALEALVGEALDRRRRP
jgi:hypothetical protein